MAKDRDINKVNFVQIPIDGLITNAGSTPVTDANFIKGGLHIVDSADSLYTGAELIFLGKTGMLAYVRDEDAYYKLTPENTWELYESSAHTMNSEIDNIKNVINTDIDPTIIKIKQDLKKIESSIGFINSGGTNAPTDINVLVLLNDLSTGLDGLTNEVRRDHTFLASTITTVRDISTRLELSETLTARIPGFDTSINNLYNLQSTNNSILKSLVYDVSILQDDIENLQLSNDTAALAGKITKIDASIAGIYNEFSIIDNNINAVSNEVNTLKTTDINSLKTSVNNINASIGELVNASYTNTSYDSSISRLEDNISKINSSLGKFDSSIRDISYEISSINSQLSKLDEIDNIQDVLNNDIVNSINAISPLQNKVQQLDASIKNIINETNDISVLLNKCNDNINDLTDWSESIDISVGELEHNVNANIISLNNINDELPKINAAVNTLSSTDILHNQTLLIHDTSINTLNTRISDAEDTLAQISDDLSVLSDNYDNHIKELDADEYITVGPTGKYKNLQDALHAASILRTSYKSDNQPTIYIKILKNTVIDKQIKVENTDLSKIVIISEQLPNPFETLCQDAINYDNTMNITAFINIYNMYINNPNTLNYHNVVEQLSCYIAYGYVNILKYAVPVNTDNFNFSTYDCRQTYPLFYGQHAGMPTISCIFVNTGTAKNASGYVANRQTTGYIDIFAGFVGFYDNIIANNGSSVMMREAIANNASRWNIHARHCSTIIARGASLSSCNKVDNLDNIITQNDNTIGAVVADRGATIDIREAYINDSYIAIQAKNASVINANGVLIKNCGFAGNNISDALIISESGSTVNLHKSYIIANNFTGDYICKVNNGGNIISTQLVRQLINVNTLFSNIETNITAAEGNIYTDKVVLNSLKLKSSDTAGGYGDIIDLNYNKIPNNAPGKIHYVYNTSLVEIINNKLEILTKNECDVKVTAVYDNDESIHDSISIHVIGEEIQELVEKIVSASNDNADENIFKNENSQIVYESKDDDLSLNDNIEICTAALHDNIANDNIIYDGETYIWSEIDNDIQSENTETFGAGIFAWINSKKEKLTDKIVNVINNITKSNKIEIELPIGKLYINIKINVNIIPDDKYTYYYIGSDGTIVDDIIAGNIANASRTIDEINITNFTPTNYTKGSLYIVIPSDKKAVITDASGAEWRFVCKDKFTLFNKEYKWIFFNGTTDPIISIINDSNDEPIIPDTYEYYYIGSDESVIDKMVAGDMSSAIATNNINFNGYIYSDVTPGILWIAIPSEYTIIVTDTTGAIWRYIDSGIFNYNNQEYMWLFYNGTTTPIITIKK